MNPFVRPIASWRQAQHVAMGVLYALQHLGYCIPPQADAGWIGEAGPGPTYGETLDDGRRAGLDNDFTQRNTTFMTWNLLHWARILRDVGGIPNYGNEAATWKAGQRFYHQTLDQRGANGGEKRSGENT